MDWVSQEVVAKIVRDRRRSRATGFGSKYECICGEAVDSNSHHVQSRHIAEKIMEYLRSVAS